MKKSSALFLISLALILVYVTTVMSQASSNEIVIDDFETYTIGQKLGGQGAWLPQVDCNITVENADASWTGKILRSGNCANGQLTQRNYAFQFTPQMRYSYLQFSGRMTSGSGNNSCVRLEISSPNEAFVFGTNHVPSLSINYRLYVSISGAGDIYGASLTPGTWYDFRLEIDWSYKSSQNKYGLATLKYRPSGTTTWLSDPAFNNLELNVLDPIQLNRLGVRMDGISSRRGEMDNIIVGQSLANADLALSQSLTPLGIALPGQALTYTLVYTNNGPDLASGVVITDTVPITVTNLSFISTGATITQVVGTSYVFQVMDLAAGEGGTINITGVISPDLTANTLFTNTATITTTAIDTDTTNNLALVNTIVSTKRDNLYLPLVLKYYPPPVFPLYVGSAIPRRPVSHQGEIFYSTAVKVPSPLPIGGYFYFSSRLDTLTQVVIDDKIVLLLGGKELFSYDFSTSGSPQATILKVPRSIMEQLAGHTITVEYRDVYSVRVEASPMWLIWVP